MSEKTGENVSPFPSKPIQIDRVMYTRATISELLQRASGVGALLGRQIASATPIDRQQILLECLAVTMRGVALVLDEFLDSEGEKREIRISGEVVSRNGGGGA